MNPETVQNIICIIWYWYHFHWGFKKSGLKWQQVNETLGCLGRHTLRSPCITERRAAIATAATWLQWKWDSRVFSLSASSGVLWWPTSVWAGHLRDGGGGWRGVRSPRIPLLHCGSRRAKKKTCVFFYLTCLIHTGRLSSACKTLSKSREPSSSSAHCSHLTGHLLYLIFLFFAPLPQQHGEGWKNCPQFLYCNPYKTGTALNQYLAIWHNYHWLISSPAGLI